MNIFFLHADPERSVKYYFDRHCVKIILEICQMLYTAQWLCHPEFVEYHLTELAPYRKTHHNHPTSKWVRRTRTNYRYTCQIGLALCKEYTKRYGKTHKCQVRLEWLSHHPITRVDTTPYSDTTYLARCNVPYYNKFSCSPIPLAMPKEYHGPDPIEAYRRYYIYAKQHIPTEKEGSIHSRLAHQWGLSEE